MFCQVKDTQCFDFADEYFFKLHITLIYTNTTDSHNHKFTAVVSCDLSLCPVFFLDVFVVVSAGIYVTTRWHYWTGKLREQERLCSAHKGSKHQCQILFFPPLPYFI